MTSSDSNFSREPKKEDKDKKTSLHASRNSFFVPTLQDLAIMNLVSMLGSMQKLNEFIMRPDQTPGLKEICTPALSKHLLSLIAQGNQTEAEEMVRVNPELLFMTSETKDYSGRTIEASPYQCALGAEDEQMLEMMKPYIDSIDPTHEKAKEQFDELFSAVEIKKEKFNFDELVKAIGEEQFTEDKLSEKTEAALQALKKALEPQGVIKQGKHFNIQQVLDAFEIYDTHKNSWNPKQLSLFWCQVIGQLQRHLPANYAQALCKKLTRSLDEKLDRSLTLSDGKLFFPLDSDAKNQLGVHFGVYGGMAMNAVLSMPRWESGRRVSSPLPGRQWLIKLCEMKTEHFDQFKNWIHAAPEQKFQKS